MINKMPHEIIAEGVVEQKADFPQTVRIKYSSRDTFLRLLVGSYAQFSGDLVFLCACSRSIRAGKVGIILLAGCRNAK